MSMRLLPKSEIQQAKASAKKQEIDQGLKLAKRIDVTRETLAEEEAKLEKFRRETVAKINAETLEATRECDEARKERDQARTDRDVALKPLDKEWKEIAKAKKQLTHDTEEATNLLSTAQETDRQAKIAIKQAADALARAATKDEVARDSLATAAREREEARVALKDALEIRGTAAALATQAQQELLHRDEEAAMRERGLILREAHLKEGEADLAKGWKLLNDRKAAFERQITRTKK